MTCLVLVCAFFKVLSLYPENVRPFPYILPQTQSFPDHISCAFIGTGHRETTWLPQRQLHFLDLMVFTDNPGNLHTSILRKQTDRSTTLHARSFHPSALRKCTGHRMSRQQPPQQDIVKPCVLVIWWTVLFPHAHWQTLSPQLLCWEALLTLTCNAHSSTLCFPVLLLFGILMN